MILILAIIVAVILIVLILRSRKRIGYSVTQTPLQPQLHNEYRLLFFSPHIENPLISYGLFQFRDRYFIVDSTTREITSLKDVYPSFNGRPIGFVVAKEGFIVFSDDGKVYNPFTISHPWRRDYFYLPAETFYSVDGRLIASDVVHGLFNGGKTNLLFRFYYRGYLIDEGGCRPSGTYKSCPQTNIPATTAALPIRSMYQYNNSLYGLASDGWIYKYNGTQKWTQNRSWIDLFGSLKFPEAEVLSRVKGMPRLYLMGADFDEGVPIFLIYENGIRYIVDRYSRKYDFFKSFKNENIFGSGNPLDLTKAGPGEYDFIVLYTDRKLYGPTIQTPTSSIEVSLFEDKYPSVKGKTLVSITSINKWMPTDDTSAFKYFLVFLYSDGQWFEVRYEIKGNRILELGQTDQTSNKWTEWKYLPRIGTDDRVFFSGPSVFIAGVKNLFYSPDRPPESWMEMLYCTSTEKGDTDVYKTSSCVGKAMIVEEPIVPERIIYSRLAPTLPGKVIHKIGMNECLKNSAPIIAYDRSEADCHLYDELQIVDTIADPTKSVYVNIQNDVAFQNRFCVKHNPTQKYLYWDFTDPNAQHIGLNDYCLYQAATDINNLTDDDIINLQKSMGAMWSSTGNGYLENMNGAMGGQLTSGGGLALIGDPAFTFLDGTLTDTKGTCFSGKSLTSSKECVKDEWSLTSIPCPPFVKDGYIFQYCAK